MTELSYQLYSARNFPPLSDHLRFLASLGYKQVEGYGGLYAGTDLAALRAELDGRGLSMPTAHVGLPQLEDTEGTRRIAAALGIKVLFCPAVSREERTRGEAGWRALGEKLAGLAAVYAADGVGFGWHNHDFEFTPTESGTVPLDLILAGSPDLQWEADVAWMQVGGQDPDAWIAKYADRLTAVHVKDIAPAVESEHEDGWADVGHGIMPWGALMKTLSTQTACKYFVMEHDNPSDANRFAERSIKALRAMGY
ncbi:MAG TPA: sugar phosphate isomerase/epimerase [Devosiaceae bacterium]|nr:sugar phosphate isomerase/epimerase [Devosiaceae bacterium]